MFKFFSFRKKESQNSSINSKLDRIIELLEQQQKDSNGQKIHIDNVKIDHLENFVFRLDKIEIDELSGKLIIGNNINAAGDLANPALPKMELDDVKKETMSDSHPFNGNQNNIIKTPKGFCYRRKSQ